jgi:hypothetical protein
LLVAACSDTSQAQPPPPEPHDIAAALTDAMTALEPEQVTMLRTSDSCRRIEYRRGAFASASPEHCSYGMDPFHPLDDTAAADIERLANALDVGRTDFAGVDNVTYAADGTPTRAEFIYNYFLGQEVFVYAPGYRLPPDQPGERTHTALTQDWYLTSVNWG